MMTPLRLADGQRRLDVDVDEKLLQSNDVRLEPSIGPATRRRSAAAAPARVIGRGHDAAVTKRAQAAAVLLDDAPAGAGRARIEAEDDHACTLPRRRLAPRPIAIRPPTAQPATASSTSSEMSKFA